jgi:RNA chaperone Hfq
MRLGTAAQPAADHSSPLYSHCAVYDTAHLGPCLVREQKLAGLVNGIRLPGYVTRFDTYGVALTRDHQSQFVYKRVISTINPMIPIRLYAGGNEVEQ